MKIIALEKELPGTEPEDFRPHLKAEAKQVYELKQQGLIDEIYFRADRSTAVIIMESENIEQAKETLSTLPLVKENLIEFELIPLAPYPGFERPDFK